VVPEELHCAIEMRPQTHGYSRSPPLSGYGSPSKQVGILSADAAELGRQRFIQELSRSAQLRFDMR